VQVVEFFGDALGVCPFHDVVPLGVSEFLIRVQWYGYFNASINRAAAFCATV